MVRHYAWVVAFCCFLLIFCNVGLASTSFNVYQPYIVALPGIGDSAGSAIIGVRTFFSLLCMFAVVRYYELFDCRLGSFIACLCSAGSMVVYGFAGSFPVFCVAAALGGIGYGLGGMVCTTYLINRWFKADVGTAIGIAAVGSGVASIIIPVFAEWAIRTFSLSLSFWLEAILALAIGVLSYTLLRNRPADLGLNAYTGKPQVVQEGKAERGIAAATMPVDHGVHLPPFARFIVVTACAITGAVCVSAMTFLSILLVSEGYDHQFAALMLSVTGFVLTVGKAAMGRIIDVLGSFRGTVIAFVSFIAGMSLLIAGATGNAIFVWLGVLVFSFGLSIGSTGIPIWSIDFSRPEERVKTVRTFQTGYATGSFAFSFVPGILKDVLGSYAISYALMTGMLVVALVMLVVEYRRYRARLSS